MSVDSKKRLLVLAIVDFLTARTMPFSFSSYTKNVLVVDLLDFDKIIRGTVTLDLTWSFHLLWEEFITSVENV